MDSLFPGVGDGLYDVMVELLKTWFSTWKDHLLKTSYNGFISFVELRYVTQTMLPDLFLIWNK